MELDPTHRFLESQIEAPHGLVHAPGERHRATYTDEHTAATATTEGGTDDNVEVFRQVGASRGEGDTRREVHAIKRASGRTRVEYGDAQASGGTLRNERGEKRDHRCQRTYNA